MELADLQSDFIAYFSDKGRSVTSDQDLFANDIIDSVDVIELVVFIESQYGIEIDQDDLSKENFCTIDAVAKTVQRYQ